MSNIWEDVSPEEITAIANYILLEEDRDPNLDTLEPWFPTEVQRGRKVRWRESLDAPFTASVPFRGFSTSMPIGTRPGGSWKTAGAMPLGISYEWTEYDEMLQAAADAGVDAVEVFRPEIFDDVRRGMIGAMNRLELLRGDLLVNAQFTVNENGLNETVSVGRSGNNTVPAGTAWTTANAATSTPHADERAAVSYLKRTFGIPWRELRVLCTSETYDKYRESDSVRADFQSFRALSSVGDEQITLMREQQNLPPIQVVDREILDPNDVLTHMIEHNAWVYVPANQPVGKSLWGQPRSALLSGLSGRVGGEGGPIAYVREEDDPPAMQTVIDAIGMAVMQAPNWTYHLQTNAGVPT